MHLRKSGPLLLLKLARPVGLASAKLPLSGTRLCHQEAQAPCPLANHLHWLPPQNVGKLSRLCRNARQNHAVPPQLRYMETTHTGPAQHKEGHFWTPIGGQTSMPIDIYAVAQVDFGRSRKYSHWSLENVAGGGDAPGFGPALCDFEISRFFSARLRWKFGNPRLLPGQAARLQSP